MLIIFDLDDTLIDTSVCITPFKLVQALHSMVNEGCRIENFTAATEQLLAFDRSSNSAREALEKFVDFIGEEKKFLEIGIHEVYSTPVRDIEITPVKGAIQLLNAIKNRCFCALVTIGKQEQQILKIEKAGIDSAIFYKIFILEDVGKKKYYQSLMEELNIPPDEVIVCGDRIHTDLAPAKELGCVTVHMRRGRGMLSRGLEDCVDFVITDLSQFEKIFLEVSNRKKLNGVSSDDK